MNGRQSVLERIQRAQRETQTRLKQIFRTGDPLKIVPYLGYGTATRLFVSGRVLEDEGIEPSEDDDTCVQNLMRMYTS